MRIVAFVVEVSSLRRLLEGLGLGPQGGRAVVSGASGAGELVSEAVEG